jgi:hypothetical protein
LLSLSFMASASCLMTDTCLPTARRGLCPSAGTSEVCSLACQEWYIRRTPSQRLAKCTENKS